jgi:hypothetical protein
MRNKDTILLENAYNTISEMAYRPLMPKYSTMPSVEKATNKPSYKEDVTERKAEAALKINKNIEELEKDPNNIEAARDTLNIINNFDKEREEFLVKGEELSYEDIIRLLLNLTTTTDNDPSLIIKKDDPNSLITSGVKVDDYLFKWDPKLKEKVKIEGRTADHYYLFRDLMKALPDVEAVIRSRREKTYEGSKSQSVFYWAKRYEVLSGYYNPGSGFYPNQKGEERGIPKMRQREFNAYLKQKKAKAEEQKILPFRTSVFIGEGGTLSGLFWETNRRIPRFEGQPEKAPAPLPYNRYRPQELSDVTLNELLLAVDSKGAEEEFRKLYPEDKYPNLYKHGKTAGIIEGKDPTEI